MILQVKLYVFYLGSIYFGFEMKMIINEFFICCSYLNTDSFFSLVYVYRNINKLSTIIIIETETSKMNLNINCVNNVALNC